MTLKIKIGDGKQYYSLNSKAKSILNGRNYDDFTLKFGKNLTYDSSIHYFDDIDNELLNFLSKINNDGDIDYNTITVSNKNYRLLMNILEKKEFDLCFDGIIYHMDKISDDYNMNIEIKKNKDSYNVLCDIDNMIIFYNDYKYIFIPPEKKIYKLNKYQQQYISATLDVYNVNIEFDKEDFNEFKKNVLPFIKSDVKLDKELEKEIKITKPSEKICLDIVNNNLLCELKFMYDDKEVDYFDIRSRNIVRDIIYEKEILSRVLNYGFNIDEENSKIYINGFDNAVYFVEEKLPDMLKEDNVYITDRLKNMNIRRKVSAHSSFTIGKDNIMKYSFDMEDIPTKELANILESLNQKKKYHRLKNGDVIDLESTKDDLEQLENFVDELDLQQKDISSGEGILPKYKAIYIDSLKNSKKYKFIETNNLFDELIQKFEKYKDKDIELKEKELKILRDYQKVGGILADEMGLGKSLQIIYFLLEQIRKNKKFKTLIVVPTAILYNWQNEIKKFAPELKYIILDGNKNHRHEILESNIKENIIITTYGILREDKD